MQNAVRKRSNYSQAHFNNISKNLNHRGVAVMNRTKQEGKVENEQRSETQSNSEHLQANAQRLLQEQRDMARITVLGRREE
jgi:predicted O-methyltransferase YrrM